MKGEGELDEKGKLCCVHQSSSFFFFFFFIRSYLSVLCMNDSHLLLLPSYYLRLWFFFITFPNPNSNPYINCNFYIFHIVCFFFSFFQNFSPSCLTIDNHKEIDNLLIIFFTTCNLLCRVLFLFFFLVLFSLGFLLAVFS